MSRKISYSQASSYINCPRFWFNQYVDKWEPEVQGASLYFGSATDSAVMAMLEGKPDWLLTFYDLWNKVYSYGKATPIFDNDLIVYSNKDFDGDLLEAKDITTIETWGKQLNLLDSNTTYNHKDIVSVYQTISKKKKNPYLTVTADEMKLWNRMSWLSLKRKGKILLEAFNVQFYPKIKKVLATQQRATIKDHNTGDEIVGVIDMVVELEGYSKPLILDLKTASQPYKQEDMDLTQQLVLYSAMKSQTYNTDLVGYVVLSKNIPKKEISNCKSCGNLKTGKHKTCEALVNGKRCGGEWDVKLIPAPEVQVLIDKKTPGQINELLLDYGNVIYGMNNSVIYKNTSKCNNHYGGPCPYKKLCWEGNSVGLKKKT